MKEIILLEQLFQIVLQTLRDWGYAEKTVYHYLSVGIRPIRRYYQEASKEIYDSKFTERIVQLVKEECFQGIAPPHRYMRIRKIAIMLEEASETGSITKARWNPGSKTQLKSSYYRDVLNDFRDAELSAGLRTPVTIETDVRRIRHFFSWLESIGCITLQQITLETIGQYITYYATLYNSKAGVITGALRKLYQFTKEHHVPCTDFAPALIVRPSPRRKLRPMFTADETANILNAVDTTTPIGKRDYAILSIAKNLGVRSGDITELKLHDIDWNANEIKFNQRKTSVDHVLPLMPAVGNAIADYILNGRPETEEEYIFICHRAPFTGLRIASGIMKKYRPATAEKFTGFHSFRRAIASKMLNAGVIPETVKDVLGHTAMDSLKPYARISDARLKSCALSLNGIECAREEWR